MARRRPRQNPTSPADIGMLVLMGGGALLTIDALQNGAITKWIGDLLHGALGGGARPVTNGPCWSTPNGNTALSFQITPYTPAANPDSLLTITGTLVGYNASDQFKHAEPLGGQNIEIWDARRCSAQWASVATQSDGTYSATWRLGDFDYSNGPIPLFAYYRGMKSFIPLLGTDADPAQTGVLQVTPQ